MLVVSGSAALDPRKLTRASEQLREVGRRNFLTKYRSSHVMGIDTEQWRARIGTYNGGKGCRILSGSYQRSPVSHAVTWTTRDIIQTIPRPVQAGIALVSLWMVLCYLHCLWKKVECSQSTKIVRGCFYYRNEYKKATLFITVCVSLLAAAVVLLHSLALFLIMAGDVELNPGPGMDTALSVGDLDIVYKKLISIREEWYSFGLLLEVNIETLNSIGIKWPGQPGMCLFDMLNCRLQTGSLTWRDLCKTLRSRVVGRYDVAVDIERSIMEGSIEEKLIKYEKAIKCGYVAVKITNVLVYGMAGTGKTCTKNFILGLPPPIQRNSTPIAEGSRVHIRNVSGMKVQVGTDKWEPITTDGLKKVVADIISCLGESIPNPPDELKTKLKQISSTQSDSGASNMGMDRIPTGSYSTKDDGFLRECLTNTIAEIETLVSKTTTSQQWMSTNWVYLIDSGGQPHFHNLLPLFVENISLAIYVFRLTDGLDDYPMVDYYRNGKPENSFVSQFTPADSFKYLMQSIQSSSNGDCRLLCIGTHRDKVGSKMVVEEKDSHLLQFVPEDFKKKCYFSNVCGEREQFILPIVANETGEDREAMGKELRTLILGCPAEEIKVPLWWYIFELDVENVCEKMKRKVLSLKQCKTIARQLHFHEDALSEALKFFHQNHIFHYYPSTLPEIVFCDTQVLLDKVTELVAHAAYLRSSTQFVMGSGELRQFKSKGILTLNVLYLFGKHYVKDLFEPAQLVRIFEELLIATPFCPSSNMVTDSTTEYYMPALLSSLPTTKLCNTRSELIVGNNTPLLIQFQNTWYRCGVFCCLQVYLIKQCGWILEEKSSVAFQNLTCLHLPHRSCSVVLIDFINYIEIHITRELSTTESDLYSQVRDCIISGIQSACSKLHYEDAEVDFAFLCPHTQLPCIQPPLSKPDLRSSHPAILLFKDKVMRCSMSKDRCYPLGDKHLKWLSTYDFDGEPVFFAWKFWKLYMLKDASIRGDDTIVAVIDTDVLLSHVTLKADNKYLFRDLYVKANFEAMDVKQLKGISHGTAVAAVICGLHVPESKVQLSQCPSSINKDLLLNADGTLPIGIAPNANYVTFGVAGSSEDPYNHQAIAESLWRILKHNESSSNKIRIINLSFKLSYRDETIKSLIDSLQQNGVICIAAAGNDGRNESPKYPALYSNVLSVGSVDGFGNLSKYSTFHSSIDVLAPGENILVPVNCLHSENELGFERGTSFAAPAVAGLIALLLQCSRKYYTDGTAWKYITDLDVLKRLFETYMVHKTDQGNLLQPPKVVQFFNDHVHEFDRVIAKLLNP